MAKRTLQEMLEKIEANGLTVEVREDPVTVQRISHGKPRQRTIRVKSYQIKESPDRVLYTALSESDLKWWYMKNLATRLEKTANFQTYMR
ncbi:hypothetical protein V0288_11165 [Pannus brasiliensis CCIBt3594]|uniref:Uncharacterized protein n=1 Tax=Pannus brasiliensis CCIBt3594 TaxID=1427578 RepID=A0AAW9QXB0_9CHRO